MDSLNKVRISVCMATYNGALFVQDQLKSILQQISPNDEVIIADDGSTDGTVNAILAFNDSRIIILPPIKEQETLSSKSKPLGPIYNLERALARASGEYVFLADQDDIWLPGKVQKMMAVLTQTESSKPACLAIHDAYLLTQGLNGTFQRGCRLSDIRPFKKGLVSNWIKNRYTGCCMAFTRDLLSKALPFPQKLPMHDQWLGFVAEKFSDVIYVNEPLIEYRQHKNNATHIVGGSVGLVQKFRWRLDLFLALRTLQ